MKINIESNFVFTVAKMCYSANGELYITLSKDGVPTACSYKYESNLGNGVAEERPKINLIEYTRSLIKKSDIKEKTKESYRLMCNHLEAYGDCSIDNITTQYLQGFLSYLQDRGLQIGTVRLYFQKLACVLHDAYKNGHFDERILLRVKRPKREQEKKSFLTEAELKRMARQKLPDEYMNIQTTRSKSVVKECGGCHLIWESYR